MRIAVTGATGQRGREAIRAALATGHEAASFGNGAIRAGETSGGRADTPRGRGGALGENDIRPSSTNAVDSVRGKVTLVEADAVADFQCTSRGATTWHGFSRKALDLAGLEDVRTHRVPQSETGRPARCPMEGLTVDTDI